MAARRLAFGEPDAFKPMPPGCNKTYGDLLAAGQPISRQASEWAFQYERSQLPPNTRFPKWGDVYEPLRRVEVAYMTMWRAPYTGGDRTTFFPGEWVQVRDMPWEDEPLGAYVDVLDYDRIEARVVPEADRRHPLYRGFYLHLTTLELNRDWRLVRERPAWPRRSSTGPRGAERPVPGVPKPN